MPGGYLYGFYKEAGEDPVKTKISCDSEGKLLIDITELFGTLYWSCAGINFDSVYPAINAVLKNVGGFIKMEADGINLTAPVFLLNGATVVGIIVYGNAAASAETFYLRRHKGVDNTVTDMATQNINTSDITITNPVIDNSLYSYFIRTTTLDTGDEIWGAFITYTL